MTKCSVFFCFAAIVITSTLSGCMTAPPEVAGMPSNAEWNAVLSQSPAAYSFLASSPVHQGGGMPPENVWNAVLEEDRKEVQNGTASAAQLKLDVEISHLLREARSAIASNDESKIRDVGAKLKVDLDQRIKIYQAFEAEAARKHPFKAVSLPRLDNYQRTQAPQGSSPGVNCVPVEGQGWSGCAPN